MNRNPLHLWCAYPDDLRAEGVTEACAALLSPEEQARWQRLRFDKHRRESLTTRALARTALSHYHPIPPKEWSFTANAHGKPVAEPECSLRFNLSNSVGLVVCLIANQAEVGVDVEAFTRASEILKLAPDVFSPAEQAQLSALRGVEKLDRALSLWTLKESYIKARGLGLSLPLKAFSFLFGGDEGVRLEVDPSVGDEPGRWRFCLLDHAAHRIALMVEAPGAGDLEMWEVRPLLATPVRVDAGAEAWFPRICGSSPQPSA